MIIKYIPFIKRRCSLRIDHIAYRVADRKKTAQFFMNAFEYTIQQEFDTSFNDGTKAKCIALEPPEKQVKNPPWAAIQLFPEAPQEYHLAPEIFISDGEAESIVGKWVKNRDGVGGIHHIAYQLTSVGTKGEAVKKKMKEWKDKGYAEFSTKEPLTCPGLCQIFTKPSELTGVIYEFIEREEFGYFVKT